MLFCRKVHGPRANLRQEPCRSSRGITGLRGAGPSRLNLASAPGVCAWATPFCPFLAKTGGSRWDFFRDIFLFLPVQSYRRFIRVSVLASNLLVQTAQHAAPLVGESFSPGSTKSSACSPTCRGISLLVVQSSACSPTKAPLRSSRQQNAQPFFTQQRSRTY